MTDPAPLIQIKGLRDSLLVTLGDAEWDMLRNALLSQVDERRSFFQGARLALDVGHHILHVTELASLRDDLSERGLTLWAVLSEEPDTQTTAQLLGLATRLSRPQPSAYAHVEEGEAEEGGALWVGRTLRSGTRVEFPGHVVVLGDVNPGAEVIAGGSVVVWGRLRGVVHAGAQGDRQAVVCALDLSPMQLRIADEIAVPAGPREEPRPEVASLRDGRLVAEPWQPGSPQTAE